MMKVNGLLLSLALMFSPLALADNLLDGAMTVDDVISIADILDGDSIRATCSLSLPADGQGVACSCSGTSCSSTGTGNQLVIKCSDSTGTTSCSIKNARCSCTTVTGGGTGGGGGVIPIGDPGVIPGPHEPHK